MSRSQDMALTVAEFFRHLPHALDGYETYRVDDATVAAESPGRHVTIRATPLEPRRLGPILVLPRTLVTLEFDGFTDDEVREFLGRFDRAFQRGGG